MVLAIISPKKNTLKTSEEDVKNTLETSEEDTETTLDTSGIDFKHTPVNSSFVRP
jgi:hypothetical protein